MSSLEMEESPGEGKLEMAFLIARRLLITWPVGRRHRLDNRDFKGKEREQILKDKQEQSKLNRTLAADRRIGGGSK